MYHSADISSLLYHTSQCWYFIIIISYITVLIFHHYCIIHHSADISSLLYHTSQCWYFIIIISYITVLIFHHYYIIHHSADISSLLYHTSQCWYFIIIISYITVLIFHHYYIIHHSADTWCLKSSGAAQNQFASLQISNSLASINLSHLCNFFNGYIGFVHPSICPSSVLPSMHPSLHLWVKQVSGW